MKNYVQIKMYIILYVQNNSNVTKTNTKRSKNQ